MTTRDFLLRTFAPLVGATSLVGCSDAPEPPLRDSFSQTLCESGTVPWVHDLNPSQTVDYRALRYSDHVSPPQVVDEVGQPCRTGSSACLTALAQVVDHSLIYWQFTGAHLALTDGDQVEVLDTHDKVLEFLGSIDTPREAALLAMLDGYNFDCDGPNWEPDERGVLLYATTGTGCYKSDVYGHRLIVDSSGNITKDASQLLEKANPNCIAGRLPQRLVSRALPQRHPVGRLYADIAHLEAASVFAFAQLEAELKLHRAPDALRARARSARRDEVRHARLTAALARRYGARPTAPRVEASAPRSLEALAIDNVREGVIRETFGALVAHHQARVAKDPVIAAVAHAIASDETEHAALSWDLMRWLTPRLSPAQRRRVRAALESAVREFEGELCQAADPLAVRLAGWPSAATSRRLFDALEARLWS